MSQRDIAEQIKNLCDVEIFPELVSKISEKIMPDVNAGKPDPLKQFTPLFSWMLYTIKSKKTIRS